MDPTTVHRIFGPAFVLIGLSHLLQPHLWVQFFKRTRESGSAAVIIALYTLPFGLFLIATHNVWERNWSLFLTIAGWVMTTKSAAYLLIPGLADRMLAKRIATTARGYQMAGALAIFFGAVLTWQAWTHV